MLLVPFCFMEETPGTNQRSQIPVTLPSPIFLVAPLSRATCPLCLSSWTALRLRVTHEGGVESRESDCNGTLTLSLFDSEERTQRLKERRRMSTNHQCRFSRVGSFMRVLYLPILFVQHSAGTSVLERVLAMLHSLRAPLVVTLATSRRGRLSIVDSFSQRLSDDTWRRWDASPMQRGGAGGDLSRANPRLAYQGRHSKRKAGFRSR